MASWLPSASSLLLEHHFGTDAATSLLNHATDTTVASIVGSPTYGTGYMDIQGHATTALKGMDLGYPITADKAHIIAVVDPNSGVGLVSSAGTNDAKAATARVWFDSNPTDANTLSINGQAITFRTSGASGFEVDIGATPQATAFATTALINANPATFAMTAYCPAGNSVINLTAVTAGAAGNSIVLGETATGIRITLGGATANVTNPSLGLAGETVTTGLVHSGANFQGRNSSQGTGGLPLIAIPGSAGYYYVSLALRLRDFGELRLFSGGAVSSIAQPYNGTGGRQRHATGNLNVALAGHGTGTGKIAFCAVYHGRLLTPAEDLAAYLAVSAQLTSLGLTVN